MPQTYKDAVGLCKTIMRNGFEAYVINAALQIQLITENDETEVDIATDAGLDDLHKLFPKVERSLEQGVLGTLSEGEALFRFYPADDHDASHPENVLVTTTPRLLKKLEERGEAPAHLACPYIPTARGASEGFEDLGSGEICFQGVASETLKRDYLLAVRALRLAANYQMPIEANTWAAIVRTARRVLDYVSVSDIMDEWRKVEAEAMGDFVQMLFDSMILHGLAPELAALSRVKQIKNESGEEQTVLAHTIAVMKRYPEELPYDFYGAIACLFHAVGKLYTAEFTDGKWHFHQYPRVGAKVTRKILNRLRFPSEDTDLVCHLVRHHARFHYMLTEKGVRRFMALDEYPRLMEMARADIKAREGNYTEFNHNLQFLEKAQTQEDVVEPLLNGKEIMQHTGLTPGPRIGIIRDALLTAQIFGEVCSVPEAIEFVTFMAADDLFPKA